MKFAMRLSPAITSPVIRPPRLPAQDRDTREPDEHAEQQVNPAPCSEVVGVDDQAVAATREG